MINKKLEIKLGGEKVQLWFNNFAVFELQSFYGVGQEQVLAKISERADENELLLLSDLVKVGIKGHCLAKGLNTPAIYDDLNTHIATADLDDLTQVFTVFYDIMGGNAESDKKKIAQVKQE